MITRGVARDFITLKPTQKSELRDIWPSYFTKQIANDKGADQTAQLCRLVWALNVLFASN